ncbi:MAG: methyltransferase type 11 [Omnitrophica bacterium RIFCSPHIGHO2_02_FULL_46_11]|nr:MAG: methyltransferase type 11 [Omnitrophica bacterium RIFCSPHIGHO2_02_FULL_46_11]OGW85576.1 MAG: methyltransferase type 11 [Omnitrophica bacterium RIFCSPLOWO2_01_FULL_45_10b]
MTKITKQMKQWSGVFGKEYTDRNTRTQEELDQLYVSNFGLTRKELNERYLQGIPKDSRILEVGCNVGDQLICLQEQGFTNLYGIELQHYAVDKATKRTNNINIIQGSALDIPFKDDFFDVVFTAGVLIHIAPVDIDTAMKEIYRCSKKYIWGYEYWADQYTTKKYRGKDDLFFKTDFAKKYMELFPDLKLLKEEKLKYKQNDDVDSVFLFQKQ